MAALELGGHAHAPTSLLLGECLTNAALQAGLPVEDSRERLDRAKAAFKLSAALNPWQLEVWERLLYFVQCRPPACVGRAIPAPLQMAMDRVGFVREEGVAADILINMSRAQKRFKV